MAYVWDSFETYRLDQQDLEKYLTGLFGHYDFLITVVNGYYKFWIPSALSTEQKEGLADLRWEDD
ncbi:hypothetical protein PtrSN002B_010502 [Pyrenophora tritici-repentis]|uniref:Uncharacterized protein n=1 Tax=Pyrenophora tritici-repentis TaxID=45151 RepID=A0A2W1CVL7_9PLEO|nr:hypothetical protein PtrV1_11191 [Pyrenophora tritici-repentis]KAF7443615.1 hypothetical protein A1F99_116890 [Pyrenophora tritici-repentis]KAF7566671.1 hypothetical protein PtrM4_149910 [Pyrenophora tritici-repentis]KAG9379352.1 hypothetical protein A1F94_009708 [Pyrenophora tritici-repentis]KAI0570781.1 hypothetical protein Alg215_10837 [Pyrenophora tritici-repentis]